MTLRRKTLTIIGLILFSLTLLLTLFMGTVLLDSFRQLETMDTEENLRRTLNALNSQLERLSTTTQDYARWDDTFEFVHGNYPDYPDLNLLDYVFTDFVVNYMIFMDTDGSIVYSTAVDLDTAEFVPVPEDVLDYVSATPVLYIHTAPAGSLAGIVALPTGIALVASRPITHSSGEGEIAGALLWIRRLTAAEIARLSQITEQSITLLALDDPQTPRFEGTTLVQPMSEERMGGYVVLNSVFGTPVAVLRIDSSRHVYEQGKTSTLFLIGALVLAGMVAAATAMILLERLVLARLLLLNAKVSRIAQTKALSERVAITGTDELSAVEREINTMLARLEEAQNQLREAKDVAETANRSKNVFLANMSHELRTPLNAIIGFLGLMLMNGNLDPKDEFRAQRAHANSERLLHVINDVLDISRIEAGRMTLVPMPFNVRGLLETVQAQMVVLAEEKSLAFHVHVEENVPHTLEMDSEALTKILVNLIGNAIKFTEQGEIDVRLTARDAQLIIKVRDTGIGIPAHMHETIFESFRQVDDSSTREYGGSGLGLAIVHHLCTAMNGTVRVESKLGEGSTFTVMLPLVAVTEMSASV